jgi:ABC-2 type transport system permease protein
LLVPLGVLYLTVFCIGLSLLLSSLAVFFRDVIHLWGVVLTAWMYLTPLFYSITILPGWMQSLMRFNPMYLYITYLRDALLMRQAPSIELTLGCAGFAVAMLAIGYLVFRRHESKFILFI